MKRTTSLLMLTILGSLAAAYGQITPSQDSYTNSATPTTNYGAKTLLDVEGPSQTTYIQFNLASIPAGASISQATLKLYVNSVTTAGSFNVDYVNSSWSEGTIDYSNAPPLGGSIASSVPVVAADKNQYLLINVTSALQAWLNGSETNNGIALVATGNLNLTFDSKENTTTSHPAELDVVFSSGEGTITGVGTASGSGLQGGGTIGTVSLSLTNACSSGQILEWNGSAWICIAAGGTGTINGVTAGSDLTGGGTSGSVTLNLDTTKVPLLAQANTFTGNQTVNGNLSATGGVTGNSFNIGSNLFGFGTYLSRNAFLGFAGNTTMTGTYNTAAGEAALINNTTGGNNTATGVAALYYNSTGWNNTAAGEDALINNTTGGNNTAVGEVALYYNTTGGGNTAVGKVAGLPADYSYITGVANTFLGAGTTLGTGTLNNATAIGANAEVDQTNSLVLGSINGVNGATASTNVGIGTTAPTHVLEVNAGTATVAQIAMVSSGTDAAISLKNTNTGAGGREYWIDSGAGVAGVGAGTFAVWDATAGAVRMVITSNGNVGLGGITAPSNPLQMADGAYERGGTWTNSSDRNMKEAFKTVDGKGLLSKLNAIRIDSWNYKSEGGQIRHLGPMAQDFYAAFGLGRDDRHISTVDEGGVALAAIQQLYREGQKKNEEISKLYEEDQRKDAEIRTLEEEIHRLKLQLGTIQALLKNISRN